MTIENPYPEVVDTVRRVQKTSYALQDTDARFRRITQGLAEVIGQDVIRASLERGRTPRVIWATAPTGKPHIGYIVAWVKMAEFVSAGAEVIVNLADIYSFLFRYKYPLPMVMQRREYYRFSFNAIFETIYGTPAPISGVRFENQSDTATEKEYITNYFKVIALMTQQDSRETEIEIKTTEMLGPLIGPPLQLLDQQLHDIDIEYGGLDQGTLFEYMDRFGAKLGHRKRAYAMNHMLPGLTGGKMSASHPGSKIDLLDPPDIVHEKVMAASCPEGTIEDNSILAVLKLLIIPVGRMRLERVGKPGIVVQDYCPFTVEGAPFRTVLSVETEKNQYKHYSSYEAIEDDFCARRVGSGDLKKAVSRVLLQLLSHVQRSYKTNPEWQKVSKLAYPEGEGISLW